jgi:arginyl-tRNA--protein-N-Asp/Glu arginylyltransferase
MKVFFREFGHSYETYSFGYKTYALRENKDLLSDIYGSGFLPYSADIKKKDMFYMARSLRINLALWEQNSENRRIWKKFVLMGKKTPIKKFDISTPQFLNFCTDYFEKRHGKGVMSEERLKHILSFFVTHIVSYETGEGVAGYVFLAEDKEMTHFFYSFYDLSLAQQSLGLWLMQDQILRAQEDGKKYFYLGTGYGDKGLYKTNFDSLEFWDGEEWVGDTKLLKQLCREDEQKTAVPTT